MAGDIDLRCARARELAALFVDGELSELEERVLARHLSGCPGCRSWDASVAAATALLRGAPLESPARPVAVPSGSGRRPSVSPVSRRLALVGVAAAAALGSLFGSTLNRAPAPGSSELPAPELSFLSGDLDQLRQLPRFDPFVPEAPRHVPGKPPEGAV